MNLITRYILKKCLFNTLLMLIAFIMLFSIFSVLGQMGDVGKGSFNSAALIVYTILVIPNYIYLLMPLAVLIGVMISMLSLVNYSEYAIIRTSGLSLKRITAILFSFGLMFSGFTFLFGEIIGPEANHYAQVYKIEKTKQIMSTNLNSGIWSKDGENNFVNIKQVMPDNTILDINIFKYDSSLRLQQLIHANGGKYNLDKKLWILNNVTINDYVHQNLTKQNVPEYMWKTAIEPSYFSVLVVAPEDMSALGLIKYIQHLKTNHQSTQRYQIAFWNKLLYPIACISMALIGLAFIPNNRRNINLGGKLFAGILIGVAFFFITRLIGYMALLFAWNAIASALTPTLILFTAGWYFVLRKE